MAIITGSLERARLKYPDIDTDRLRLIGWGAGQFFRDYYPWLQRHLPIEYTVCPVSGDQGKSIHGVRVLPPSELSKESPANTLVVILARHFPEIMNQISAQFSGFRSVQAMAFDESSIALIDELQDIARLHPTLAIRRTLPAQPKTGIFIQGLVFEFTPLVLAWNRLHFPSAYQCMVTWDHQPRELLDRCRPWLDRLMLVKQPENLGLLHRNAVWRSARLGAEHLDEQNIEFAVRCRSDNILRGSIHEAIQALFSRSRNIGRIAVSLGASWQHMPFHFSEKAMLARTKDMVALWSLPEDGRPASHAAGELSSRLELSPERHFQDLHHYTPESALWKAYAQRLGFPVESLGDAYRFAQARLLALEPYLGWHSLKFTPLFNAAADTGFSFSLESWNRLFTDGESAIQRAEAVSRLQLNSTDFWQGRVG